MQAGLQQARRTPHQKSHSEHHSHGRSVSQDSSHERLRSGTVAPVSGTGRGVTVVPKPLFRNACGWLSVALTMILGLAGTSGAFADTGGLCQAKSPEPLEVGSARDLAAALRQAKCGTTVTLAAGRYDSDIKIAKDCEATKPLVLSSEEAHSAVLTGKLGLNGRHIVVDGLRVDGGRIELGGETNRITRTQFVSGGGLVIRGASGRIDHNEFDLGAGAGIDVALKLSRHDRRPARDNLIDYNLFHSTSGSGGDVERADEDDDEDHRPSVALYLGQFSARKGRADMLAYGMTNTLVENNLFQDVARHRSIHVKSNGNIIRNNTFIASANVKHGGQITIRSGQNNEISGNYVSGRIRVVLFEEDNRAIGNVLVDGAQLVVMAGGGEMTQYDGPQQRPAMRSFLAGNQGILKIGEAVARRQNKAPAEGTVVEAHQGPIEKELEADTTVRAETSVSLPEVRPLGPEEVGPQAADPLCPKA
ncbi:MAG: hypothetical protein AB7O95_16260 [Geminicoccaceae bacterium]